MSDAPDFRPQTGQERDTAIPRFSIVAERNNRRSEEEGHPCFDDIEMVEIIIPGDRTASWFGMVNQGHKNRWPAQYAAFKSGQEGGVDGTPLTELPGMTASQAEELRYQHIRSVESLAALSDEQVRKSVSMGGLALRDKAQRWLDATKGAEAEEKLAAENRDLKAKMEGLERQMADLIARLPETTPGPAVVATGEPQ